ncbi:amidohydrolase family protein [bacterium]|nr:amidohydrolase family protein [bacterium]
MNVTRINNMSKINFSGKIIDAHAHIGKHDGINYTKQDLDVFVKSKLANNDEVEKIIVSDIDVLHGVKDEYKGNFDTFNLLKNDPHYEFLISCNPQKGNVCEIEKLYKSNLEKIVGLKFHPSIQNLELIDKKYEAYMDFATKNNLPCLFHSEVQTLADGKIDTQKILISDPQKIYELARKYSKTPVVMAHMGGGWAEAHDKAIDVLINSIKNGDANLYADVSWVDIDHPQTHIIKAIKMLNGIGEKDWSYGDQSFRLMFGTDIPLARFKNNNSDDSIKNYTKFVENIKSAIRNDKDLGINSEKIIEDLFYNNAQKLYKTSKTIPQNNILKPVICGILLLSSVFTACWFANKDNLNKNMPKIQNKSI